MEILCLTGYGSSSHVFERQIAALRKQLPESFEYVFVEGEIECNRHLCKPVFIVYTWRSNSDSHTFRYARSFLLLVQES
ncbi:uncharacterized protein EKO05_0005501 [Ascochyta rabiei]|uniref:uncharacterized protein n=1 Tax=Didymella rabiei TaxID=5454 RepID=UPI0021FF1AA6|nr:uncharacterized protein EKO05_0005501 [Ascochyta rabiei]UPX15034.1 hypothetical protein EKO05_0005501 [Ascochyta rabiei]